MTPNALFARYNISLRSSNGRAIRYMPGWIVLMGRKADLRFVMLNYGAAPDVIELSDFLAIMIR